MDPNSQNLPNIQPYTVEQVPNAYEPIQDYDEVPKSSYDDGGEKKKLPLPLPVILVIVFVILCLLAFIVLALTGKKATDNTNANDNTTDNNQAVQIRWMGVFLDEDLVTPLIEEYEAAHTNVNIEYFNEWPTDTDYASAEVKYRTNLLNLFNDPLTSPDIFMVNNTWVQEFLGKAYPSPASTLDATTFSSTYYPAATTDFVTAGQVYGLPMWMDTLAIVYNEDLLVTKTNQSIDPPTEWPAFSLFAESISNFESADNPIAGFAAGNPANTSFSFELMNILLVQNGIQIADANGLPIFATNADAVGAFEFYRSFLSDPQTWTSTMGYDAASFLEGRAAMVVATSWRYRDLLKYNDQYDLGLNIGVTNIPQLAGQTETMVDWATYWGNMVNKDSFYPQESWDFLVWLNEPAQQEKLYASTKETYGYFGAMSARVDMAASLSEEKPLEIFLAALPYAKSWKMPKGIETKNLFNNTLKSGVTAASLTTLQTNIMQLWTDVSVERSADQ